MGDARRMRMAGTLISAIHLACGITGWLVLDLPGAMLLFGLCAAITLGIALIVSPLMRRPPDDDGGLGTGKDGPPPGDPPWWPDFERDFRDYAQGVPAGR